jgi:Tol biopolymer transport system component
MVQLDGQSSRPERAPSSQSGYEQAEVVVQSIGSEQRTVVWRGGMAARYVPTGHLVYAQGTALFAIAFDPTARTISGGPVPLMDGIRRSGNGFSDTANYGISDTGTFAHIPGAPDATQEAETILTTMVWIDRDGREEPLPIRPDDYTSARVSPDGTKLALVVGASLGRPNPPAIWIYDTETRNLRLMATEPAVHDGPVWSGDSRRIYFRSPGERALDINVIDLETGEVAAVTKGSPEGFPFMLSWSLSPDEQTLAIINAQDQTDVDIATIDLTNGQPTRMLFGPGQQNEPAFAPNGTWLAHMEAETIGGASEINIRPFPNVFRTLIPVGAGQSPVFSRDGTQLFFQSGTGISAVPVEYEPTLRVGTPTAVIESSDYMWNLFGRTWDPDPTGERFIVPRSPDAPVDDDGDDSNLSRIDIVVNWLEELKARVPTP